MHPEKANNCATTTSTISAFRSPNCSMLGHSITISPYRVISVGIASPMTCPLFPHTGSYDILVLVRFYNIPRSRRSCGKVGNAFFRVFQACRFLANVFSMVRGCPRHILVRRQIPQTAVRTLLVIFHSPFRNLAPGIEQILNPTHVQTLFSQPPVKVLHARILGRHARLNLYHLDPRSTHHARKCRLLNSGPLSTRIAPGIPRSAMIASNTRVTRRLAKLVSTSNTGHSCV